jgi:hypothetical protein
MRAHDKHSTRRAAREAFARLTRATVEQCARCFIVPIPWNES